MSKKMKTLALAAISLAALTSGPAVERAHADGVVTPTSISMTIISIDLLGDNNDTTNMYPIDTDGDAEGSLPVTFRKDDQDFVKVPLADIRVPDGRYYGTRMCAKGERRITLEGEIYSGPTNAGITDGTAIHLASTDGTVSTTAQSSPVTYTSQQAGKSCSDAYFAKPFCVSKSKKSCKPEDSHFDTSGGNKPDIVLVMDMYDGLNVDNTGKVNGQGPYPIALVGLPGGAVHLNFRSGTTVANIMVLLDGSGGVSVVRGFTFDPSNVAGFCAGEPFTTVTGVPASTYQNQYGPTMVMKYDSSTGKLQYLARREENNSATYPGGINILDNIRQEVGGTVNATCVVDENASPSKLGFTYDSTGHTGRGGSSAFKVVRIMDPNNLLGTCPTGTCGTYRQP